MDANERKCPVCGHPDTQMDLIGIKDVPVFCNVLLPDKESALNASKGDIDLVFCENCAHVYNKAFDQSKTEYSANYDNSLHYSPKFQAYAESLAERLVEKYALKGKTIIEIGCGKGDFLNLLCKMGDNRGIGFDPSYEAERVSEIDGKRFTVIQDYYSDKYAEINADLVVCRHVLEHIQSPRIFLDSVRKAIGDRKDTVVFFEVPNAMYTLKELGIWDLIYEHCSYFTTSSLAHVFESSKFFPVSVKSDFEGQFIHIEAFPEKKENYPVSIETEDMNEVTIYARNFARAYKDKLKEWDQHLHVMNRDKKKVVSWGAGSKGVTFLNIMGGKAPIDHIVDINPNKKGRHVPGTGQKVVDIKELTSVQPDVLIIMNALYENEIRQMLFAHNLNCKIVKA